MDEVQEKIAFHRNEEVSICLYLANYLLETKKITKQLSISVKRLLDQFKDVVAIYSNDLGWTNVLKHRIHLVYLFSITAQLKTFDPLIQRKMKQEIQFLLEREIIQPSNSLYSVSISVVEKKNKTIRYALH